MPKSNIVIANLGSHIVGLKLKNIFKGKQFYKLVIHAENSQKTALARFQQILEDTKMTNMYFLK